MEIDWFNAPVVPVDVILRRARGLPLDGQIVTGPFGQETFVPDCPTVKGQIKPPVSFALGGGVYATTK